MVNRYKILCQNEIVKSKFPETLSLFCYDKCEHEHKCGIDRSKSNNEACDDYIPKPTLDDLWKWAMKDYNWYVFLKEFKRWLEDRWDAHCGIIFSGHPHDYYESLEEALLTYLLEKGK